MQPNIKEIWDKTMNILPDTVLRKLADRGIIKSMAEGRRLLRGGGIKIDGETIKENVSLKGTETIKVGKRTIDLTD